MTAITDQRIMTEQQAREVTERIRFTARNFVEVRQKLMDAVSEARQGQAHVALGYASWTAYLSDVMGEEPLRLARDERREVVQMLTDEGMSRPAIAQITGVNERTTQRDFRAMRQGETPVSPSPTPRVPNATSMASAPSAGAGVSAPRITGMDGKQYSRPEPPKPAVSQVENAARPKRRPITDLIGQHANVIDQELAKLIDALDERATCIPAQEIVRPAIHRWEMRLKELAHACGLEQNETPAHGEGSK